MAFFTTQDGYPKSSTIIPTMVVAILIGIVFFSSWTVVGTGEKTIVTRYGEVVRTLDSGLNFLTPIVENTVTFDVRTQKENFAVSAASKDLQTVAANLAINYNLSPDAVVSMYTEVGQDYTTRIIAPAVHESAKAATAQFTADELVTKRAAVKDAIRTTLTERMLAYGIVVTDVSIVDFDFSDSFNEAIERKVTAEQNALASKNKLEQVKYESEQRLVQARAEAEAIRIQAGAINAQGGADYVKLQWINSVGKNWDGKLPATVLGETIPFLNVPN